MDRLPGLLGLFLSVGLVRRLADVTVTRALARSAGLLVLVAVETELYAASLQHPFAESIELILYGDQVGEARRRRTSSETGTVTSVMSQIGSGN
jgi:hypothetical protein